MKLSEMSKQYNENNGDLVGFLFKSQKTKKLFKTIAVSPHGSFLVESLGGGEIKEHLLRGDVDRYDFVDAAIQENILRARALKIEIKTLNGEISDLESAIEAKYDRVGELEVELEQFPVGEFDTVDREEEAV